MTQAERSVKSQLIVSRIPESKSTMEEELNKVAEQYASDNAPDYPDVDWVDTFDAAKSAFVAGAKWMAEQGVTRKGIIVDEIAYNSVAVILDNESEFKPNDRVIVQIRKTK